MNETLVMVPACIAGGVLGTIFFGGLWWTVGKGITSKQPALWFFGSLLLRTCITLAGFYFVSANHWKQTLACLAGFALARVSVRWITAPETNHAP